MNLKPRHPSLAALHFQSDMAVFRKLSQKSVNYFEVDMKDAGSQILFAKRSTLFLFSLTEFDNISNDVQIEK